MRTVKKLGIATAALMGLMITAGAGAALAQSSGGFFEMPSPGVRPQGMGNAFVAVADDINSIYFNPSGLAMITNQQVQVTHTDLYGFGIEYNYIAYAQQGYGVSWAHLDAGSFLMGGGSQKFTQDVYTFSGGAQIDPLTYLGGALKIIKMDYSPPNLAGANRSASVEGYSVDIGVLHVVDSITQVGAMVRDLFGELKSSAAGFDDRFEESISIGFSRRPNPTTLFSAELGDVGDEMTIHLGVEKLLEHNLSLRAGYDDDVFCAGVGFRQNQWEINYAYKNKIGLGGGEDVTQRIGGIIHF